MDCQEEAAYTDHAHCPGLVMLSNKTAFVSAQDVFSRGLTQVVDGTVDRTTMFVVASQKWCANLQLEAAADAATFTSDERLCMQCLSC